MAFNSGAFLQARQAGANALAAGISSAGNSIADGITEHTKQAKKLKALQGSAVDIFGMDKDKVAQMSAEDLQQQLGDSIIKQQMERAAAAEQRQQQDQEFQMTQRAAGQQFQKQLSPMPPGMEGPEQPLSPQRLMAAAAQTGYQLDPRVIAQFAQEGQQGGLPEGMTVDGVPLLVSKRTGKFEVRPDYLAKLNAENKTKADPSLILSRRTKALADWEKLVSPVEENLRRAESNLKNSKLKAYHPQYEADIKTLTGKLRQLTAERPRFDGEDDAPAAAEAAAKPAQGGYKIGTRYSGLTYMGGDPKQESSWQK